MIIKLYSIAAMLLATDPAASDGFLSSRPLWKVINVLVFALILVYILRNKIGIGKIFDNRAAAITKELEQARRDKEQAERQLAELSARLNRLDDELAEIRAETARESAREAERIHQAALADAEKIRQMASREIEGAVKAARTELRAFVAEQSVEMAEAIIRREIRPEDNNQMITRYVEELREVNR